jgi:hypothetical protein
VWRLTEADRAAMEVCAAQLSKEEREEGDVGLDHLVAFGAFEGNRLAMVGNTI